jgi:hypothetical protein
MDENSSEQIQIFRELEKRIKQRYGRRTEFLSHLIAFVIGIPVMWLIILTWLPDLAFWDIVGAIVTGGWTMGFLIHLVQVLGQEMEDRAITNEMERLGLLAASKRKRDNEQQNGAERLVRLSDDGEIIDLELDVHEERESHYG